MKKVYHNFKHSINDLGGLGRNASALLATVVSRLTYHLHKDDTLGSIMRNRGILSSSLRKIKYKIEEMEADRHKMCKIKSKHWRWLSSIRKMPIWGSQNKHNLEPELDY